MKHMQSENRLDRGGWFLLAFVGLFFLTVLASTVAILRTPGDGWQIPYGDFDVGNYTLDHFVGSWETPLKPGDVVIALDGQKLPESTPLSPREAPDGWVEGGTVKYTIRRDGSMMDVPVKLHRLGWRGILRGLAYTMVEELPQWGWFLAGLFIFALRPKNQAARLLLIAGVSIASVTRIGWAATTLSLIFVSPAIWYIYFVLTFFWGLLFYPSLILLLLSFPIPLWPLTRYARLTVSLVYGIPLLLSSLTLLLEEVWPVALVLIGEAVLIFAAAGGAIFQVYRQKHNRVARAQVSWVAAGIVVSIGGTLVVYLAVYFGQQWAFGNVLESIISWPVALALPTSLFIAILRYRLFEIDIIIRRTLQYAILTLILFGTYFGGVVLLQNIFGAVAGQTDSPLITVVSTLAIAALFTPLRTRIQDFIDRRFYRTKYDAEKALAGFAAAARDEVDISTISERFLAVVSETVQPENVQLLLKTPKKHL